ncbi:hypothetical protein N9M78_03540 [Alphaproteobacteria bacterium]|nr:hypothetical protein [Alphaproteobacteria bacterium]
MNESEYNSASSTGGAFNGFNDGKQDPAQLNTIEISPGVKAVVWAVNTWKDFGDGRWDSNYDLVYRIIDTTNAAFLTEERRVTEDFSSDYINTVIVDQSGGFNVVWGNNLSDINLLSVASSFDGF